ncbi:MAG TPA: hypothetical protein PKB13_07070 [Clostridia bacterium]|nr:hypothetical protein [Clostridia bacterium]
MNKDIISGITASSIEKYLIAHDWKRDFSFKNSKIKAFDSELYNIRIALVANESYQDFPYSLGEIFRTLSILEQRDIYEIKKDIQLACFDRMEFRIVSPSTKDGKLPLDYATECILGLKDLILYSACAEQNAQPICPRPTGSAKMTLSKFKLAQTEAGSFIINIDAQVDDGCSPIGEQTAISSVCETRTELHGEMEHRVIERIATAFKQINEVVDNKTYISDLATTAYITGITANMCDALEKIRPSAFPTTIETKIRYSSSLPDSNERNVSISLNERHFAAASEISKVYRNREIVRDVELKGYVKLLSRPTEEENVIRLFTVYENKTRIIMIDLNDKDNRKACDAYRDENEVEVAGELDMSGRMWVLRNVRFFNILSRSEGY